MGETEKLATVVNCKTAGFTKCEKLHWSLNYKWKEFIDVLIRTKKTKFENKLKTMVNRNKIKKTFITTSEEQDSHVKRTVLNSLMIDV